MLYCWLFLVSACLLFEHCCIYGLFAVLLCVFVVFGVICLLRFRLLWVCLRVYIVCLGCLCLFDFAFSLDADDSGWFGTRCWVCLVV